MKRPFAFNNQCAKEYLRSKNICYTKGLLNADVIVTSGGIKMHHIGNFLSLFKKVITWTNEPRHSRIFYNFRRRNLATMNVYSGDVFLHNLHFLGSYHHNFLLNLGIDLHSPPGIPLTIQKLAEKKKFSIAIFAYRNPDKCKLLCHQKNLDLYVKRQELATFLYHHNKCDIVGNNWPEQINVLESSGAETGSKDWWDRKLTLMENYKFNICFENTVYPYYCTEKIWQAIACGCLPVYYGKGTAIYQTFPENSFIDASKFSTNEDLFEYMENLPPTEHVKRYNVCLEVMHRSCAERLENPELTTDIIARFTKNIVQMSQSQNKGLPAYFLKRT